jgi:hypothetical protein
MGVFIAVINFFTALQVRVPKRVQATVEDA